MSSTVTVALQEAELPYTSATVRVTELDPMLAQVNEDWLIDMEAIPQLSDEPLSIWAGTNEAFPEPSKYIDTFLHVTEGDRLSITVTLDTQVEILPLGSIPVKVIWAAPEMPFTKWEPNPVTSSTA